MSSIVSKIFSLKTLKYVLITISAFLLLGIIGYFSLRNYILQKAIAKVKNKVENATYIKLSINNAQFTAYNTVQFTEISLVPDNRDTLLTIDTVTATVKILPSLLGNISLSRLSIESPILNLRKDSIQNNFRALLKPQVKKTNTNVETDKAKKIYRFIKAAAKSIPDKLLIQKATLKLKYNDSVQQATLQQFSYLQNNLFGIITPSRVVDSTAEQAINIAGSFDRETFSGDITLNSLSETTTIGWASLVKSGLSFNKLKLSFNGLEYKDKTLQVNLISEGEKLRLFNSKLAKDTAVIDNYFAAIKAKVDRNFITLDSSSYINLNLLKASLFAQYPISKTKHYTLKVNTPRTEAQQFFKSLPQGMFSTLKGIEVKGKLSYSLNCFIDGVMPDSLKFESKLEKEDFKITKYGKVNYTKINQPFIHTVYEGDKKLRTINVSDTNPYFTPLADVSPHFVNALLINEDPSFFRHRGFIPQSFRDAIAAVYKADGKFVRGGSTISMQLVKNAFLERRKTIARKAEEALIVWLIENNRLVSKERMFEVYLNIIEFAPGVYGIGEASEFYFNKKPTDLTLAEGIYLSNIIPRPKAFKYGFEKDGTMKYWLQEKANLVVKRMVQREQLPASDSTNFSPQVELRGKAKNFVIPKDSFFIPPPPNLEYYPELDIDINE